MKKINYILAAGAALMLTGCAETWDGNPILATHEGIKEATFLNEPVMKNMPIMITSETQNGTFHLTCSQPDFGYAAVAFYHVQVSLTSDFTTYEEISQDFTNCAEINPTNSDMAIAIEKLSGVKTEDDLPLPYQEIFVRLRSFLPQSESNTQYISNVVSYKAVSVDYLAVWVSDVPINLYLRGGMNEWGSPEAFQFVTGPDENTWVSAVVDIPAGTGYKVADDSWGSMNIGAGDAGGSMTPNVPHSVVNDGGSGNLTMDVDFHGYAHLAFSKGKYTLTMVPVE